MKDCGEYQREISLLIDGELAEPQKTGLLRHIGQCGECRRVYDAFNAISLSLPEEAAPAGFAEDVMSAIKGLNVTPMPVPEKKRPFRWKRAAALAACLPWSSPRRPRCRAWPPPAPRRRPRSPPYLA